MSIRPHELRLTKANSSINKPVIKGKVISIKSLGSFSEVLIDNGEFELLTNIDNSHQIDVANDVSLYIEKK